MSTVSIIAHLENASQVEAVKAFMKALKIKFEVSKDKPYNPEFVTEILKAEQEIKHGKSLTVTPQGFDDLWK